MRCWTCHSELVLVEHDPPVQWSHIPKYVCPSGCDDVQDPMQDAKATRAKPYDQQICRG